MTRHVVPPLGEIQKQGTHERNRLKTGLHTLILLMLSATAFAGKQGTLIFSDDFNRNESQEIKDEIGKEWGSNSKSRAKGNKQVDLKDGAMHIYRHAEADHAVSVTHPAEFKDGTVELRFMLENAGDSLGLNFADLKFKEVHAGHLCMVKISTKDITISDLKTGKMGKEIYAVRKAKQPLTDTQKEKLKSTENKFQNKLENGKWHDLEVTIKGDTMTVTIDGMETASFSSEGIAHPTKRTLRLSVPKKAVIDDLKIYNNKSS